MGTSKLELDRYRSEHGIVGHVGGYVSWSGASQRVTWTLATLRAHLATIRDPDFRAEWELHVAACEAAVRDAVEHRNETERRDSRMAAESLMLKAQGCYSSETMRSIAAWLRQPCETTSDAVVAAIADTMCVDDSVARARWLTISAKHD